MSLFIGNPRYEDISSYKIKLKDNTKIDKTTLKDDIFGIEFYGMKFDSPKNKSQLTPHNAVKAKRLYASRYLSFEPGCIELNSVGIDDFAQYAGPFMWRECATIYDTETGFQKVVAYKDQTDSNTWYSTYDDILNDTKDNKLKKVSTAYNIVWEIPKFWYCRPSRYTFLVSTGDKTNQYIDTHDENGNIIQIPWHLSPLHERKNSSGTYDIYNKCYVSKYLVIKITDSDTKLNYFVSHGLNYSKTLPYSETASTLHSSKGNTIPILVNSNMYCMDYPLFSCMRMLNFIKYGTLNFSTYLGYPIGGNATSTSALPGTIKIAGGEGTFLTNCQTLEKKIYPKNCPDIRYYANSSTTIATNQSARLLGINNFYTVQSYLSGLIAITTNQSLANTLIKPPKSERIGPDENTWLYTTTNLKLRDYYTYTQATSTFVNNTNFTYFGESFSTSSNSTKVILSDFNWSPSMAKNKDIAWTNWTTNNSIIANANESFIFGWHLAHLPASDKNTLYLWYSRGALLSQCAIATNSSAPHTVRTFFYTHNS